jgi:hypothetical protein
MGRTERNPSKRMTDIERYSLTVEAGKRTEQSTAKKSVVRNAD